MINKIINSEDPKYQSETISELVFDTTGGGSAPTTLLDSSLSAWVI